MGKIAGVMELDLRQKTVASYLDNRTRYLQSIELDLASPLYKPLVGADMDNPTAQANEDALLRAVDELRPTSDFIVIDCPGSHTRMAQVAHSLADTLITPLNDSFVDFDLLAKVDNDGEKIIGPSVYSEMVWSARQKRAQAGQAPIDWVVLRNRLGAQQMVNKLKLEKAIDRLAKRIGFRVSPGFSERVIFRELFPRGLTLLDLKDTGVKQLNISNVAARQELRELIKTLNLPDVQINF
jgi:chromosome partitioning protein